MNKPEPEFASLQERIPIDEIEEDQILFYDIECDHVHAPYATLNKIGVQYGFNGKRNILNSTSDKDIFRRKFADPEIFKVGFNNGNYDDIVLSRYGFVPSRHRWHDGFLIFKAISALLPSYGLKFINWWYLGDHHFPEGKVVNFMKQTKTNDFSAIPPHLLHPYLGHDLVQHCNAFRLGYPIVQQTDHHWNAYMLDCSAVPAVQEMILRGGVWVNLDHCETKISKLAKRRDEIQAEANQKTGGMVTNVNSTKQVGEMLDLDGLEVELSEAGNFSIKKSDLMDLRSKHPLAQMMYEVRDINGNIKYFEAYKEAASHSTVTQTKGKNGPKLFWIPGAWGVSTLRTRRFGSGSLYGINFQNPNGDAKEAQEVPEGMLGVWIDATQVENIVHIYESEDDERRAAYEADEDWSEYVWLTNKVLGGSRTKEELDAIQSPQNPAWSVYKQYKTVKLMLNFGAGPAKFSLVTGFEKETAYDLFEQIHDACPAIRGLQNKYADLVRRNGYVLDVFDHIYSGPVKKAYKIVAYAVQGCGTGSLPKAQIRANWETLQSRHAGFMCGTTHDDNSSRLYLDLGTNDIIATLQEMMYNMTAMFSPRFGGIPLRAKLYLSKTNAKHAKEISINDLEGLRQIIDGNPCPTCGATGKIKVLDAKPVVCSSCNGYGYGIGKPLQQMRTTPLSERKKAMRTVQGGSVAYRQSLKSILRAP